MMTTVLLSLYLKGLVLLILTIPSFQLSSTATTGFDRAVQKVSLKLRQIGKNSSNGNKEEEKGVLVVDGNNVRGIAKFEWGPLELMSRVSKFCQDYNLNGVVVWDHGHCKYADVYLDNLTLIFSGLSRRADDIIVKESTQLAKFFSNDDDASNNYNLSPLAFVTNDGELQHRIKTSSTTILDGNTHGQLKINETNNKPLVIDSTRFVALLSQVLDEDMHIEEDEVSMAVLEAERTLRRHAEVRRTRHNPRREFTWQRCVVAEAMCSALRQRSLSRIDDHNNIKSPTFAMRYAHNLQKRGYKGPGIQNKNVDDEQSSAAHYSVKKTIHCPSRLDKKQRRQLQNYVQALQGGRLD